MILIILWKKKINQSPLSINILKCLSFSFSFSKEKKNVSGGKKIGNELEKKLHSRKVDPNRPNGPNELKKTVMDRNRPNRLCMTEMDWSRP